jgi:hypothetical protein
MLITRPTLEGELAVLGGDAYAGIIAARRYHAATGTVREECTFPNLITAAALSALHNGSLVRQLTTYCGVGTGTDAPQPTNTQLGAQLGARRNATTTGNNDVGVGSSAAPYWNWWRRVIVFTEGQAAGALTELGFFSAATGGVMFNHALFKDEAGNPSAFVVLPDEQLVVELYVRVYPPSQDEQGEFTVTGSGLHPYTARIAGANSIAAPYPVWSAGEGPFYTDPALYPGEDYITRDSAGIYAATQSQLTGTTGAGRPNSRTGNMATGMTLTWNPTNGNYAAGIQYVALGIRQDSTRIIGKHQFSIPTPIMKDASKRLVLNVIRPNPPTRYEGPL